MSNNGRQTLREVAREACEHESKSSQQIRWLKKYFDDHPAEQDKIKDELFYRAYMDEIHSIRAQLRAQAKSGKNRRSARRPRGPATSTSVRKAALGTFMGWFVGDKQFAECRGPELLKSAKVDFAQADGKYKVGNFKVAVARRIGQHMVKEKLTESALEGLWAEVERSGKQSSLAGVA